MHKQTQTFTKKKKQTNADSGILLMEGIMGVRKGPWAKEEDDLLKKCVEEYGEGKWHQVPSKAGLNRCRKSCRLRWLNYLKPDINRGEFTVDEVDLLLRLHNLLGNRWSLIAGRLPGRTANDVKNYWNTHLQKKYGKHIMKANNKDHQKMVSGPKVIRPRPRTFKKLSSLMNISTRNIVSTRTTTTMDSKNNIAHQEENHGDPISPLEKDIKWWESLLYDKLEANDGNTYSAVVRGSDGEANNMEKFSAEGVEPAAAGSSTGIGEIPVEVDQSFWRDFSMDIDLWDL